MRRKPMQNNSGRQHHNNNGGGGGGQRRNNSGSYNNNNRPRKNYSQLRENYLGKARDALSSGDRVMAEYYFQHADHCYRMMMEEGYRPRSSNYNDQFIEPPQSSSSSVAIVESANREISVTETENADEIIAANPSALPGFLTMGFTQEAQNNSQQQASIAQNWEEN